MRGLTRYDRYFLPLFAGTVGLAWVALLLWDMSPYSRYLYHDWTTQGLLASLCASLPGGEVLVPGLIFVAGWVLMTAAMMLPTTLPLVMVFRRMTFAMPRGGTLVTALLSGYLAAWTAFGIAAHALGLAAGELVRRSVWLTFNGWLIGAAVLLCAGLFQFTSLKYRCLDACRSPLGFVTARWQGRRPLPESFRLGWSHGVYCVGCCWPLMLVMMAVGMGSIGWMLALGAFMALEKNSPWGPRIGRPVGASLIIMAAGLTAAGLGVGTGG
jgi:predicted metal-binding membrane protein